MSVSLGAVGLLFKLDNDLGNAALGDSLSLDNIGRLELALAGDIVGLYGVLLKSVLDDGRSNLEDAAESAVAGDSAVKLHGGVTLGGGLGGLVSLVVESNDLSYIGAVECVRICSSGGFGCGSVL